MGDVKRVNVHPVVLFTITDSYERRKEDARRVVGTLLGSVEANSVTITNAFCVPHTESEDEVAFEMEYAKNMFELHKKVNKNEVIVGWYATGHGITEHSVLIHEYYTKETKSKSPVHLTVDTSFVSGEIGFKAYISSPVGVPGKTQGMMFSPVDVNVLYYDAERVGLDRIMTGTMNRGGQVSMPTDFQTVVQSTSKLLSIIDVVLEYIDKVKNGAVPSDSTTGRYLMNLINSVPQLDKDEFETMLNNSINDLLMVRYLTNIVKSQLSLNEKLVNTAVLQHS